MFDSSGKLTYEWLGRSSSPISFFNLNSPGLFLERTGAIDTVDGSSSSFFLSSTSRFV